jgi:hypothetical protein
MWNLVVIDVGVHGLGASFWIFLYKRLFPLDGSNRFLDGFQLVFSKSFQYIRVGLGDLPYIVG